MHIRRIIVVALACFGVAACSSAPRIITEYRIDVQQGNVLTQEMVAQLRPGLTRDQVRFVLGTPMLADIFHAQRWDYVYRFQNGRTGAVDTRKLSVFFNQDGQLERVSGDVDLAQADDLNGPVARTQVLDLGSLPAGGEAKSLPPAQEKSFFGAVLETIGF